MKARWAALCVIAILCSVPFLVWAAGEPPVQPTATAAPLFVRHTNAGLACSVCHAENPPAKPVQSPTCEGCHGDYTKLAEMTIDDVPNPHASHWGNLDCAMCHHMHRPSENYCAKCHPFDFKVP